jgi:hypothetical protein
MRQPQKTKSGLFKRPLMKKEVTPKNVKELIQKTSDKKEATPENAKGLIQKASNEKRGNPEKMHRAYPEDLRRKKRQP